MLTTSSANFDKNRDNYFFFIRNDLLCVLCDLLLYTEDLKSLSSSVELKLYKKNYENFVIFIWVRNKNFLFIVRIKKQNVDKNYISPDKNGMI